MYTKRERERERKKERNRAYQTQQWHDVGAKGDANIIYEPDPVRPELPIGFINKLRSPSKYIYIYIYI